MEIWLWEGIERQNKLEGKDNEIEEHHRKPQTNSNERSQYKNTIPFQVLSFSSKRWQQQTAENLQTILDCGNELNRQMQQMELKNRNRKYNKSLQ